MRTRTRHLPAGTGLALLAGALLAVGCAAITSYDPTSYKLATDLKAESLQLIEEAQEPPKPHAAEIHGLRLKLRQAYEYEKGKGDRNRVTRDQWAVMTDPNGSLLGGFLRKWETENRGQSPAFLDGIAKNVGDAFDKIIEIESRKVKD
jgi:hypothetical protein